MLNNNHIIKTLSNAFLFLSLICIISSGAFSCAMSEMSLSNEKTNNPLSGAYQEIRKQVPTPPGPPYGK